MSTAVETRTDPDSPLAWAYRYAHAGLAVFPVWSVRADGLCACGDPHDGSGNAELKARDVGKHPRFRESFSAATTDLAVLEAWFTDTTNLNIALAPGTSGLFAVDIDGPEGEAEWDQLQQHNEVAPETLTARSGRADGGRHLIFALPEGTLFRGLKLADHIDTRCMNGYLVVSPSVHRSGKPYAWTNWGTRPAPLPAWIVNVIESKGTAEARSYGPQPAAMTDDALEWLPDNARQRLIATARPQGKRSEEMFAVVRMLVAAGLDDRQIRAAMQRNPTAQAKGDIDRHTRLCLDKVSGDRPAVTYERTDTGNAHRFARHNAHRFRYASALDWLMWDGRRWARDNTGQVVEAAKAEADAMLVDATSIADDAEERKRAIAWALKSQSAGHIDAMIRLSRSDPRVSVSVDELDANPWLLNVENGTIDLRAGLLHPHQRGDLLTKLGPTTYDPAATAPTWERFLEQVLPDPDVREFFARWHGYCLTGSVREQKLVMAYGSGANGKTTAEETFAKVLGDYAQAAEPDLFLERRGAHPDGIARLKGARFVTAAEVGSGRRLAEDVVKRLTGGDTVTARHMYGSWFEFTPSAKFTVLVNHRPDVRTGDHATWRRLRVVPFTVTIAEEDQDHDLADKLSQETPGILTWAVAACHRWHQDGLNEPAAVHAATNDYRAENDLVGTFLAETCETDDTAATAASDMFDAFTTWAKANGEEPVSQRRLGHALTEHGIDRAKVGSQRRWHWVGIRITTTKANP